MEVRYFPQEYKTQTLVYMYQCKEPERVSSFKNLNVTHESLLLILGNITH